MVISSEDVENQGYLFPQSKSFFDGAILSGKYKIENASDQPVPGVTASWVVDVTNNAAGGIVQIANCVKGDASVLGKTYRRRHIHINRRRMASMERDPG